MIDIKVNKWNEAIFNLANFFDCDIAEVLALEDEEIERLTWLLALHNIRKSK